MAQAARLHVRDAAVEVVFEAVGLGGVHGVGEGGEEVEDLLGVGLGGGFFLGGGGGKGR